MIALGYNDEFAKRYFVEYSRLSHDCTVSFRKGTTEEETGDRNGLEDWTVQLVDTRVSCATSGRIKRRSRYLVEGVAFLLTWGDGVSTVDLDALVEFHSSHVS